MALSTGQITNTFRQVLKRDPTGEEIRQYAGRNDLEGTPGQQLLMSELSSMSGASGSPFEQVNQSIEATFKQLQDEVVTKFGEYQAGNPFRIDEVLAGKRAEASEQIDPYYDEILGDYLSGVTTKINRGRDDATDLLGELGASENAFSENVRLALSDAVEGARSGFSEAGLGSSGAALRAEGRAEVGAASDLGDYMRKSQYQRGQITNNLSRGIEDINMDKKGYVTNLERNRFTDISTRSGDLAKEAGQQYIQGFQSTLPPSLQSASGFDMLKSLGIYS